MNRTLVVTSKAESEIDQAADWYDQHNRRSAVGFCDAVDKAFDTIRDNPEQYQIVYRQTRRVLLDGYPALSYLVCRTQVKVVSCFHTARDPKLWR